MKFSRFSENREKIFGQYKDVFARYDRNYSNALFSELKSIYDKERYEVLGKGKALKYFFERISNDFGSRGLKNAIQSTKLHINYRRDCGLAVDSIEEICNHYEEKI